MPPPLLQITNSLLLSHLWPSYPLRPQRGRQQNQDPNQTPNQSRLEKEMSTTQETIHSIPSVPVPILAMDSDDSGSDSGSGTGVGQDSLWSQEYSSSGAGIRMAAGIDALFGFILFVFICGCIYQWRRGRTRRLLAELEAAGLAHGHQGVYGLPGLRRGGQLGQNLGQQQSHYLGQQQEGRGQTENGVPPPAYEEPTTIGSRDGGVGDAGGGSTGGMTRFSGEVEAARPVVVMEAPSRGKVGGGEAKGTGTQSTLGEQQTKGEQGKSEGKEK